MKPSKTQYCIKSCPTDDTEQLELLLNTMAAEGWDLYTMQEAEDNDDGYQFNCIFVKEVYPEDISKEDFSNYLGFKTKMERIMAPHQEPLDICIDIQKKIKDKRAKISKIKSVLDSTSEDSRKHLNEEMSVNIKELENLKNIDFGGTIGEAAVTEHSTDGFAFRNFFHDGFRHIFIKAGD